MDQLSVAITGGYAGSWGETCRESLKRFTPGLEQVTEVSWNADLGQVLHQLPTPFVAFLDSRLAVAPGWAERLIRAIDRCACDAVGPLSNGAVGFQHRACDYQDIPGYLTFAEQVANDYASQVKTVDRLEGFCILTKRELLAALDASTHVGELVGAIKAGGYSMGVALDTYLHSFAGYYDHARPEVQPLIPRDARTVLDVGCGAGALGAVLKRRGPVEVVGVEADPQAAAAAQGILDRVHLGDIEVLNLPYGADTFDCIVLADVLEHLRDPWGVLRRLAPLLRPHGRLIASLPNVRHWSVLCGLLQGEWTYLPAGILDQGHLRFFTLKSGRALLEGAGLSILEVHPLCSGSGPDLASLIEAGRLLSLDCTTLAEAARVTQYLYVAERRG